MRLIPPSDATFLLSESRAQPMHVAGLYRYDPPDAADADYVSQRYQELLTHTAVRPRLRLRPASTFSRIGQLWWTEDAEVDLTYHVRRVALPVPGGVAELHDLVARLHAEPLDRHRPLWETYLIEGLDGGGFATYTKIHHALYDGIGMIRLTTDWLARDPAATGAIPWWSAAHEPSAGRTRTGPELLASLGRVRAAAGQAPVLARDLLGMGSALARSTGRAVRGDTAGLPYLAPSTVLNEPIAPGRRFAAGSWPIDRIRAVGKANGATVNDVVLAMCAGALRRYLADLDARPDRSLLAGVPVSLRPVGDLGVAGNAVGMVVCDLATDQADPRARLATIVGAMRQIRRELAGPSRRRIQWLTTVVGTGTFVSSTVPGAVSVTAPAFNLVISNVPGPRSTLYWNGARLTGVYPLSMPQERQLLNITVISYAGRLHFGLVGCRRRLPHLDRAVDYLADSLDELGG